MAKRHFSNEEIDEIHDFVERVLLVRHSGGTVKEVTVIGRGLRDTDLLVRWGDVPGAPFIFDTEVNRLVGCRSVWVAVDIERAQELLRKVR